MISNQRRWTKQLILSEIRRRKKSSLPLRRYLVYREQRPLPSAATRYFGNWSRALRAAGIDPLSVVNGWNAQRVIEAIAQRHARGESLNSAAVQRSQASLYKAAQRWLASWPSAVAAAGFELKPMARPKWSRQAILQ